MKKVINYLLGLLGYRIRKIQPEAPAARTMKEALQMLASAHPLNTIIDVGASNGIWSRTAMTFYPNSQYLLIEANPVHVPGLKIFVDENPNAQFALMAAGDKQGGTINFAFSEGDPFAGQASYSTEDHVSVIPLTSIDHEVATRNLKGPFLIKLDTHGFEMPIFKGAASTLKETEAIIVECYNFKISSECLLFYEMCGYLDNLGFRCIDMADPLWRPYDNAFWQMDLVFIRKDSPQFSYSNYQ